MKIIYLALLLCWSSFCYSQKTSASINNNFVLNGEVAGRDSGPIILQYQDSTNAWLSDTAWLKKGKFVFKGLIDQPTLGILGNPKFEIGGEMNSVSFF